MKIVYFSQLPFTDNDFPLIRAFQQQGIDVYYYIQINSFRLRAGLIDIKEQIPKNGIFKASEYQEFLMYKDYIDLNKIFVVNSTKSLGLHPKTILLYLKLVKHIKSFRANIIHITWPLMGIKLLLYAFRKKIVLTLHDPFPHSGKESLKFELYRRLSIALIDRIVMLNNRNVRMFCEYYNYPFSKILVTQMGEFDYMRNVKCLSETKDKPYILFFGYISQYKGVEILLESMKYIHEKYANIKLVVAGGGKIYFDKSLYEEQDYIEIRNCYIGIPELVGLLRGCLFAVCPYKDATQSGVIRTAFSLNVPVIATDVGALPDAVTDGVTGAIIPPCDVNALTCKIDDWLKNPQKINLMRCNIESIWRKKMNWVPIVKQYEEFYKEFIFNQS